MKLRISKVISSALIIIFILIVLGCENLKYKNCNINVTNNYSEIEIPEDEYDLYFLGESHGNKESRLILKEYLKKLNEKYNVQDIIIEEDWLANEIANKYILDEEVDLNESLYYRKDIIEIIKELNQYKIENNKFRIHLVDSSYNPTNPIKTLYTYYKNLASKNEQIKIQEYNDFNNLSSESRIDLYNKLLYDYYEVDNTSVDNLIATEKIANLIKNQNYKESIEFRENLIFENIKYILDKNEGRKFLIFFGGLHGSKISQEILISDKQKVKLIPFTNHLTDYGYKIHSIICIPVSGESFYRSGNYIHGDLNIMGTSDEKEIIIEQIDKMNNDEILQLKTVGLELGIESKSDNDPGFKIRGVCDSYDEIIFIKKVTPFYK